MSREGRDRLRMLMNEVSHSHECRRVNLHVTLEPSTYRPRRAAVSPIEPPIEDVAAPGEIGHDEASILTCPCTLDDYVGSVRSCLLRITCRPGGGDERSALAHPCL